MDALKKEFARNVRAQRVAHGFSQAEAAEHLGLAAEAYGRLERGQVLPRVETLVRLSNVYGVSTDALLGLAAGDGGSTTSRPVRTELRKLLADAEQLPPAALRHLVAFLDALKPARRSG